MILKIKAVHFFFWICIVGTCINICMLYGEKCELCWFKFISAVNFALILISFKEIPHDEKGKTIKVRGNPP